VAKRKEKKSAVKHKSALKATPYGRTNYEIGRLVDLYIIIDCTS